MPSIGYLAVSGRRGPVATPTFYAESAGRYWFFARRKTLKVGALRKDPAASLLIQESHAWRLIRGRVVVFDVLRPVVDLELMLESMQIPAAVARYARRNGPALLNLWRNNPGLLLQVARAGKVALCLCPTDGFTLPQPRREPDLVLSSRVDGYPVAVPGCASGGGFVTLSARAHSMLAGEVAAPASITRLVECDGVVQPNGTVTLGRATHVKANRIAFVPRSSTVWEGTRRMRSWERSDPVSVEAGSEDTNR